MLPSSEVQPTLPDASADLKKIAALITAAPLVFASRLWAAQCSVHFEGLESYLEDNIRAHLQQTDDDDAGALVRRVPVAVKEGLRPFGYYEPFVHIVSERNDEGEITDLNAIVRPGARILLADNHVILSGEAAFEKPFQELLKTVPEAGTPLSHAAYEAFKSSLTLLAMQYGFFDGKFIKRNLNVSPIRGTAFWDIEYDSGMRYRFGKVSFENSQIEPAYMQGLIPFKEGDPYDFTRYGELSQNLTQTEWFGSVALSPDFDTAGADPKKKLPITAVVEPRKKNIIETGFGFATDVGPHGKIKWARPWINKRGHSLSALTSVSSEEQELDLTYKIPSMKKPPTDYWSVQAGYKHSTLNDTDSSSTALSGAQFHVTESQWTRKISIDFLYDNFTQADSANSTLAVYPSISFTRTRAKGGLMPTWGDSQRYALSIANRAWGSEIDFMLLSVSQSWVRSPAIGHILVGRWSAGWIETSDFEKVPPDLRFFAGGDLSVRGYDYESISPKNDKGELTGGSKLITAGVEYQYNIKGNWWGAVFFDCGQSSHDFNFGDLKQGAGVGVRWKSPIGPVKLDVARAIGDSEETGWKIYVGLGGAL